MKVFNKSEQKSKDMDFYLIFENMTDQEQIELLAAMCEICSPRIVKGLMIPRFQAEYVLRNDEDLEIAKFLFFKQGVRLKTGKVVFNGVDRFSSLHSRCFFVQNSKFNKIKNLMKRIDYKNNEIAKQESRDKWWDLQNKLSSIRQDLYQNTK
ncbi:MAG: hypothetical protein J6S57_02785 [Alphaproteobacteria bacterium]|nr:hypothetical protein [Alphaproteobacteria bacterium]